MASEFLSFEHPAHLKGAVLTQAASLLLSHVRIVNNKQLAETLTVSRQTLYRWRKQGLIAFTKVKGKIYYSLSDVIVLLQSGYTRSIEISIEEKNLKIEKSFHNANIINNA